MLRGALLGVSALAFALTVAGAGARAEDDPVVAQAKANVAKLAGPQNYWDGPTSSPKPEPGKKIVFMSLDEQNDSSRVWGQFTKEAGEKVGWTVTIIDGRGSPKSWIEGFDQAIALKPDGIITTADIASLQDPVKEALRQNIVVMGIHGWAYPGPNKDLGVFDNIQQDPKEIGRAQADWIIADSGGKARVIVTTHCEFQIACTKAQRDQGPDPGVQGLQGPRVLEHADQRVLAAPALARHDLGAEIRHAALHHLGRRLHGRLPDPGARAGGVDPKEVILVSADGNRSAYERIRAGNQYQLVTVSEPHPEQGYQAIDEFNRAFHGQPPSGWHQAPYLVTPQNVNAEGGDKNEFIPSNGFADRYLTMWGVKK